MAIQRSVTLFVIPTGHGPAGVPEPAASFSVEAARVDELRAAVREVVEGRGLRLRSVSFGPKGLVAYAEGPA